MKEKRICSMRTMRSFKLRLSGSLRVHLHAKSKPKLTKYLLVVYLKGLPNSF